MNRKVEVVNAQYITQEQLQQIEKTRSSYRAGAVRYDTVEDLVMDLSDGENINICNLCFVIGDDWFIAYEDEDVAIEIRMWVKDFNSDASMAQYAEMIEAFKRLFVENQDKFFIASLLYESSYQFYLRLKKLGYVEEVTHDLTSTRKLFPNTKKLDGILDKEIMLEMERYFGIMHRVSFLITDKFLEKYSPEDAGLKHALDLGKLTI